MSVSPAPDSLEFALREAGRVMEHTPAAALAHAQRAADLAVVRGDERAAAWARTFEARARGYMGELDRGFQMAVPLPEAFEALGDARGGAYALTDMSGYLADHGDARGARAAIDRGIASARLGGDVQTEVQLLENRGAVSLLEGDAERARHECLLAIGRATATSHLCAVSHLNLTLIELEALSARPFGPVRGQRVTAAVALAAQAVAACRDHRFRTVQALCMQAEALAWADDGDRAVGAAMAAVHLAGDMGGEITAAAESARAVALAAAGRRPEALVSADQSVNGASEGGDAWRTAVRIRELVVSGALGSR